MNAIQDANTRAARQFGHRFVPFVTSWFKSNGVGADHPPGLTRGARLPDSGGMTRNELAKRIADVALLRGEFTLRSGRKSNYYLDKYLFETQPDVLVELGKLFAEHVTPDVQRIAGAELGAVALAAATAMACGKPFVIIRNQKKDYGTSKLIEGVLEKGEKVLIVEDVLTTGGQVIEAAKTLIDA